MGLLKTRPPKSAEELAAIRAKDDADAKAQRDQYADRDDGYYVTHSNFTKAAPDKGTKITNMSKDRKSFMGESGNGGPNKYTYNESTGMYHAEGGDIVRIGYSGSKKKKEEPKKSSGGGGGGKKPKGKYNTNPTPGNTGNKELDTRTADLQAKIDGYKLDMQKLMLLMAELAKPIKARGPEINAITEAVSETATTDTETSVLTNTYMAPQEKKKKSYLTPIAVG